ncbi:MAG TPA: Stf0 family sulfotransferase [Actinomycetota bacterium]|nr:Stf0 family sulfotransferase [Actinomycetota bacterium]
MNPDVCYLVCATPRSGSTLVCKALTQTGVAGRPEEYFEALRHSGQPRRPEEYFVGVDDPSIIEHLRERSEGSQPRPQPPMWGRTTYDKYLEWAMAEGTTPNGVFGAKLMWGYFRDFESLLRNVPAYRKVSLANLLPTVFPNLQYVRVVRASKVRQAVSLWKAVQTDRWSDSPAEDSETATDSAGGDELEPLRPPLRFHYKAIDHLIDKLIAEEAFWDAFFEHCRIRPILVLYENFAADYETSTLNLMERLGLKRPDQMHFSPPLRQQSDGINDDWVRRYSDIKLGAALDLVPVPKQV